MVTQKGNGSLRYLFEDSVLDIGRRELHRDGKVVAVAPQVFDLLEYLIRNREHVVSKDDLIAAIWDGRIVSDAALTTRLNVARGAIGDSGDEQRLIKTLPRKGFRFVGTVRGRELGVRYVLEGSVRKAGNRVRITGQLIDAETGTHLWADRFDSQLEDIFDLQDQVTISVIGAIFPQVERAEIERARRKPTESLQAYDYYLRALSVTYLFTREGNLEVLRLTKIASSIDPTFALAYAVGANSFSQRKAFGWRVDAAREIAEARQLAERAIQLDTDDPLVLAEAGQAYSYLLEEPEKGAAFLAKAVALNPNLAAARHWNGWTQVYLGNIDAAMEQFSTVLRLSPLNPRLFLTQTGLAYAHFFAGRYDESLFWATGAVQNRPNFLGAQRMVMASLAMSGRIAEARRSCAAVMQADPTVSISSIRNRTPLCRSEDVEKLGQAYRIAGVPE